MVAGVFNLLEVRSAGIFSFTDFQQNTHAFVATEPIEPARMPVSYELRLALQLVAAVGWL